MSRRAISSSPVAQAGAVEALVATSPGVGAPMPSAPADVFAALSPRSVASPLATASSVTTPPELALLLEAPEIRGATFEGLLFALELGGERVVEHDLASAAAVHALFDGGAFVLGELGVDLATLVDPTLRVLFELHTDAPGDGLTTAFRLVPEPALCVLLLAALAGRIARSRVRG